MEQVKPPGRVRKRGRTAWVIAFVLAGVAVAAIAARSFRRGSSRDDPAMLGELYAAWNAVQADQVDRAALLLDRRERAVSPTALDRMLRAEIGERRGDLDSALEALRLIPEDDPLAAQGWLKAGQIERKRHRARAAEAALRRAVQRDPGLIQAYRELAYLYALQRREAECDSQFRELARRTTLDYVLAFAWCQNLTNIWDPYASGEVLARFVAEDPEDRASRLALATSYQLATRPADALAALEPLPDDDPDARAIRAQLAIDQGDIATAEELTFGGPKDHARLNVLRGQVALFRNQPDRAVASFRAALEHDPDDRDALQGLGLALRRQGDPEAERFLDRAARFDQLRRTIQDSVTTMRSDKKLFSKLGALCESLDRAAEARAWYVLAIGRDPLDAEAQQAIARLDRTSGSDRAGDPP